MGLMSPQLMFTLGVACGALGVLILLATVYCEVKWPPLGRESEL